MRRVLIPLIVLALVAGGCATRSERATRLPALPVNLDDDIGNVGVGACRLTLGPGLGAQVTEVIAGTAADGVLVVGDTIVDVDRVRVSTSAALGEVLRAHEVGDLVSIGVVRDGSEPLVVEVVLEEHPDLPGVPLIGVITTTGEERRAVRTLADDPAFAGPLLRVVRFESRYLLFDPVNVQWSALLQVPVVGGETFVTSESEVYQFDAFLDGSVFIMGSIRGSLAPVAAEGWDVLASLTLIDGVLLVGAIQEDLTRPSGIQSAVLGLDAATGEVLWTALVEDQSSGSFIPTSAARDPFHNRALIRMTPLGEANPESHLMITFDAGEPALGPIRGIPDGALVMGWFARDRLIWVDTPQSLPTPHITEVITGSTVADTLPSLSGVRTVWPAGDGAHLMMSDGANLLYARVGSEEVRLLTVDCGAGVFGEPGWAGIQSSVDRVGQHL